MLIWIWIDADHNCEHHFVIPSDVFQIFYIYQIIFKTGLPSLKARFYFDLLFYIVLCFVLSIVPKKVACFYALCISHFI